MTNNQILVLDAVVKAGSFKKASEYLFKSQSALSISVKNLEEELGFKIFSRKDYRPKLTLKGKQFYNKAKVLARDFESLEVYGKELAEFEDPLISISLDNVYPIEQVEMVLKQFKKQNPSIKIKLSSDILDGGIEKLKEDKVDFCIAPEFFQNDEFLFKEVCLVEFVSVVSPSLKEEMRQTPIEMGTIPQIIVNSSARNPSGFTVGVLKDGHHWFVGDQSLKKEFILRAMGWGNIPTHQITRELDKKELITLDEFRERSYVKLGLFKKKNKPLGKNAQKLWQLFENTYDN